MAPDRIRLDFSVNTNPFGMPEGVRKVLADAAELGGYYPDITCRRLREKILDHEKSHYQGVQAAQISQIVAGNVFQTVPLDKLRLPARRLGGINGLVRVFYAGKNISAWKYFCTVLFLLLIL